MPTYSTSYPSDGPALDVNRTGRHVARRDAVPCWRSMLDVGGHYRHTVRCYSTGPRPNVGHAIGLSLILLIGYQLYELSLIYACFKT